MRLRILALVLALCTMLSLLCACGTKKEGSMEYTLSQGDLAVTYDPQAMSLRVEHNGTSWDWLPKACYVELPGGKKLSFARAQCESEQIETDGCVAVRSRYHSFVSAWGRKYPFELTTTVGVEADGQTLRFEIAGEGDEPGDIKEICWPAAFAYDESEGGTVLPMMQGVLIPAKWEKKVDTRYNNGKIYDRDGYLPLFGQYGAQSGYCAIFDTSWDARYDYGHTPGGGTRVQPVWRSSLGQVGYKRTLLYTFQNDCDYNSMARLYRAYLEERGSFVSLEEKIERNPTIARLIGAPIVHTGIAEHISPKSDYYKPDDPEHNDHYTTFAERARQLEKLREHGIERAYLHLDGWGKHGYDNLHPDPFPPHEAAGGAQGMAELSRVCRALGYTFGIHDQYRDYYYDAPGFNLDNAIQNLDGSHPYCSIWNGGPHSYLCAELAPGYVRKNYGQFERLGIVIEGAYLDVFSVVELDECFNPAHPMTREQCAQARRACFEELTAQGIIPSSEEATDAMLPFIALVHHAPLATTNMGDYENSEAVGVPIPLTSLVYHDSFVIPWGIVDPAGGGCGIPGSDWSYLYALLTAGTVYCSIEGYTWNESYMALMREALELQEKLAHTEMLRHEFLDNTYRRQRSTFADGTTVTVDFEENIWEIG